MAKVFMVRHQRAGIVTSHVFAQPPTDEQQAPIIAECNRLHGAELKGKPCWTSIHEAELVTTEIPAFPARASEDAVKPVTVSGTGTVTNPEK